MLLSIIVTKKRNDYTVGNLKENNVYVKIEVLYFNLFNRNFHPYALKIIMRFRLTISVFDELKKYIDTN